MRFNPQLKRFGQWPNKPKPINLLESDELKYRSQ